MTLGMMFLQAATAVGETASAVGAEAAAQTREIAAAPSWIIETNWGGIIIGAIFILSIIGVALFLERLFFLSKIRTNTKKLLTQIKIALKQDRIVEAVAICNNEGGPVANLLKVGIENRKLKRRDIREMMEDAASSELPKLERGVGTISLFAKISPMFGLLGTIIGMIQLFGNMATQGVNMVSLSGGISTALITTFTGLIVAIPLLIFYNLLTARINLFVHTMESAAAELLSVVSTHAGAGESGDLHI